MARMHTILDKEFPLETLPADAPESACGLLGFWSDHARADALPTRDDFNAQHLAPWIEDLSIYDYHPDIDDYQLTLEGENLVALTGEVWRGAFARELDSHFSTNLHAAMSVARTTEHPKLDMLRILDADWHRWVRLVLPVLRKNKGEKDVFQVFLAVFQMP